MSILVVFRVLTFFSWKYGVVGKIAAGPPRPRGGREGVRAQRHRVVVCFRGVVFRPRPVGSDEQELGRKA